MKLGNLNTGLSTKFNLPGRVGKKKHKHVILKKSAKLVGKGLFKLLQLIASNPYSLVIFITVVVGSIAYLIYSIDYQLTQIMVQYQALSARPTDSKAGYDKRVVFVTTDANGNTTLTVGYQSEAAEEEAQQALEEAGVTSAASNGSTSSLNIPGDLLDYMHNTSISISSDAKDSTYKGLLKVCTDAGVAPEYVAGVMGNIASEGAIGRFEKIPYNSTSHEYYKNSWQYAYVYNQFPDSLVVSDKAHLYSDVLSNKYSYDVNMTFEQLKECLSVTSDKDPRSIFGYGMIQGTSDSWHQKFISAIDIYGLTGTIDFDGAAVLEIYTISNDVKNQFSNGVKELRNDVSLEFTYDDLIRELGVTDPYEVEVVKAAARWCTSVEICGGYKTLSTNKTRARNALTLYRAMKSNGVLQ